MATRHLVFNVAVSGDIVDVDTDLIKVPLPDPTQVTINKISINSINTAVGTPTIEVRSTTGGGGDGITTTFVNGEDYAEQAGSFVPTDFIWIRSGTVGNLKDINVTIRYNY